MKSWEVLLFARQMSKAKKKQEKPVNEVVDKASGPVILNKNGHISISILAKPGAKSNAITDVSNEGVGVQIAGKAVDGEANAELLSYMSSVLDVRKNEIHLDKGNKSRQKTLVISKQNCSVDYIISKLREEMGK